MSGKTIGAVIFLIIAILIFAPVGFSGSDGADVVVTYGETTFNNANYKSIVDNYFGVDNAKESVITANDVNKISSGISNKHYNSNQIFSCAMVDLTSDNNIRIDVDSSMITTVTPSMYKSALESAGITRGYVKITSPVVATGESALAGVMQCYEESTGVDIPDEVKDAANAEIYTQAEIVDNTGASADDVAKIMDEVKEEVAKQNTTDRNTIVSIVNNVVNNYNINISDSDIDNIVNTVEQTQAVKDQAADYQSQINDFVNSEEGQSFIDSLLAFINSLLHGSSSAGN
ncbi:MAG: hypothetical protein BZ135_06155 [Methanosphaera sp. rholeuAM6]|nr:MAG: hypothetical protein BZ135_06155 [Methanosphaera sp. rholeuAM6]